MNLPIIVLGVLVMIASAIYFLVVFWLAKDMEVNPVLRKLFWVWTVILSLLFGSGAFLVYFNGEF